MQNEGNLAVAAAPQEGVLSIIERAVANPDIDVSKMRELFELQKDFMNLKAKQAFADAMNKCQAEIEPVFRDAQNPSNRSKYAKYETVDAAIRPIYTKHGFSLSFGSAAPSEPGSVKVTCIVRHSLGHEQSYELESGVDDVGIKGERNKTRVQGTGSTTQYLRRYLTGMIFNVVYTNEDNDGHAASKLITQHQQDAIIAALDKAAKTAQALCQSLKIENIGQIESAWFDSVMAKIKSAQA